MKSEYKISRTRFSTEIIDFIDSWNMPMSVRFHYNENGTFILRAWNADYAEAMEIVKAAQQQFEKAKNGQGFKMNGEYKTSKKQFPVSILSDRVIRKLPRSVVTLYEEGDDTFIFRAHIFDYDDAMKILKGEAA